ncbi:MAG: hypothetical protein GX275_14420, partial [Clostridiales bacterium]|nr:hypothetical protein [Clostridiales bacterium]
MTYNTGNILNTYNEGKIVYDAKGNMIYGPLNGVYVNYEYDCRNRLIKVGNTEYVYDAENNRIAVIENGVRTDYVINPENSLSQILIKRDSKGNEVYYIYGNGLIGEKSGVTYLTYHFDSRGSTVTITDINGKIVSRFAYDIYGKLRWSWGSKKTPFMYNGRDGVVTDNNGLIYMRARYYNIELKRFINQDIVVGDIQ